MTKNNKEYKGVEDNFRFEMLKRELDFLRDFIEGIEVSIKSTVENYKGSPLESERVGEYMIQHSSSIFVQYSEELIEYVLKDFKGRRYEVDGEEGVSLEVKSIKYNEPVKIVDGRPQLLNNPNNVKMVLVVVEERVEIGKVRK